MEKTGVIVTAYIWDDEKGYITRNIDIADLKPGMRVREIGGLFEVTGETTEDSEDYIICTNHGYYSPLCFETENKKVQRSPESDHVIDFITVDEYGKETEWHMTASEMIDRFNGNEPLPDFEDTVLDCAFANQRLKFKTFYDLWYTFCWV